MRFHGDRLRGAGSALLAALILASSGCAGGAGTPNTSIPTSANQAAPAAEKDKVLYSFQNPPDGQTPLAALLDSGGTKLYGTTSAGGASGLGTVFAVTTAGKEKVLHNFSSGGDGEFPMGGTLLNVGGKLYGTTFNGGTTNTGTVFTITPSGNESVLYSFGFAPDGETPYAGLVSVGSSGTLYGTTVNGGKGAVGTVFKITTSGKESVIYSFQGIPDGVKPYAGLADVGGALYGETLGGGKNGDGTVFKITPSGNETILYSFAGSPDGANPYGGLIDVGGKLYGTTYSGGTGGIGVGTVFKNYDRRERDRPL